MSPTGPRLIAAPHGEKPRGRVTMERDGAVLGGAGPSHTDTSGRVIDSRTRA